MAKTPATNDVFMREVDEELRRDEMMAFGRKYGAIIIGLIVLGLIVLGGMLYWRHHKEERAAAQGAQYQNAVNALAQQNFDAAAPDLAKLSDSKIQGYRAMARFAEADALLAKKDLKGAAAKLGAIASDTSVDKALRDMALVRQTNVEFDSLSPDQVIERLRPLASAGNPWFGSAGEMVAVAYLEQGHDDLARDMFSKIGADENVPDSIRQRAVQMANLLQAGSNEPAGDAQDKDKTAK